jgi:nicotinamidase-related amidase
MPVTVLDDRPALIVVDLQLGTTRNPTVHPVSAVVGNAAELAVSFRKMGFPVVLATMDLASAKPGRAELGGAPGAVPADFAELVPELTPAAGDVLIRRSTWSCFAGTSLHAALLEQAVTQVVIVGLATSFGVESTARQAYDLGYNVVLVTDAMSDMRAEAHENSVRRIFPILGETGTTSEVLALARDRKQTSG